MRIISWAMKASFARDAERIHELYKRLNRCAMGTAVLANSSWPLNRKRMADLLGFDGIINNSVYAGEISPVRHFARGGRIVSSNGGPPRRGFERHPHAISPDPALAAARRGLDLYQQRDAAEAQSRRHHARARGSLRRRGAGRYGDAPRAQRDHRNDRLQGIPVVETSACSRTPST